MIYADGTGTATFTGTSDLFGPVSLTINAVQNTFPTSAAIIGTVTDGPPAGGGGGAIINRIFGVAPGYAPEELDDIFYNMPGPPGQQGIPGQSASLWPYRAYTGATSGYPGDGNVEWNNATQISSTHIYISHLTQNPPGQDIDVIFVALQSGQDVYIQDANDSTNFQKWVLSGTPTNINPNTSTSYWDLPVTLVSSGGTGTTNFPNNHEIFVLILRQGTPGAAGAIGATGLPAISEDGNDGLDGLPGMQGATGQQGPAGSSSSGIGIPGIDGTNYDDDIGYFGSIELPAQKAAVKVSSFSLTNLSVPLSTLFSSFNGGTAVITTTDKSDRLQIISTFNGNHLAGLQLNSISTPYTIDIGLDFCQPLNGASGAFTVGLLLSDGTKYKTYTIGTLNNTTNIRTDTWATTASTPTAITTTVTFIIGEAWLRITDDGATRSYYISSKGKDFVLYTSEATNTFVTPTKFGIAIMNSSASGSSVTKFAVHHWLVTSSVLGDAS